MIKSLYLACGFLAPVASLRVASDTPLVFALEKSKNINHYPKAFQEIKPPLYNDGQTLRLKSGEYWKWPVVDGDWEDITNYEFDIHAKRLIKRNISKIFTDKTDFGNGFGKIYANQIGRGTYGLVYAIQLSTSSKIRVIKLAVNGGAQEDFLREFNNNRSLVDGLNSSTDLSDDERRHALNGIQHLEYFEDTKYPIPCLVSNHAGRSLQDIWRYSLASYSPQDRLNLIYNISQELLAVLSICHRITYDVTLDGVTTKVQFVHRDIKHDNICVDLNDFNKPIVRLVDFGLSSSAKNFPFPLTTYWFESPDYYVLQANVPRVFRGIDALEHSVVDSNNDLRRLKRKLHREFEYHYLPVERGEAANPVPYLPCAKADLWSVGVIMVLLLGDWNPSRHWRDGETKCLPVTIDWKNNAHFYKKKDMEQKFDHNIDEYLVNSVSQSMDRFGEGFVTNDYNGKWTELTNCAKDLLKFDKSQRYDSLNFDSPTPVHDSHILNSLEEVLNVANAPKRKVHNLQRRVSKEEDWVSETSTRDSEGSLSPERHAVCNDRECQSPIPSPSKTLAHDSALEAVTKLQKLFDEAPINEPFAMNVEQEDHMANFPLVSDQEEIVEDQYSNPFDRDQYAKFSKQEHALTSVAKNKSRYLEQEHESTSVAKTKPRFVVPGYEFKDDGDY